MVCLSLWTTEFGILQVPYENYRKVFRISQRNIERELGSIKTLSSELQNYPKTNEDNLEGALKTVDGMITRVENLKRKVCPSCPRRFQ